MKMSSNTGSELPYLKGFQATMRDDQNRTQFFDYFQDSRFSACEAFTLLNGDAVTKSFSLDFEHRDKNNNFYIKSTRAAAPQEEMTARVPRKTAEPLPEESKKKGKAR